MHNTLLARQTAGRKVHLLGDRPVTRIFAYRNIRPRSQIILRYILIYIFQILFLYYTGIVYGHEQGEGGSYRITEDWGKKCRGAENFENAWCKVWHDGCTRCEVDKDNKRACMRYGVTEKCVPQFVYCDEWDLSKKPKNCSAWTDGIHFYGGASVRAPTIELHQQIRCIKGL
jgi:hypothetical protein